MHGPQLVTLFVVSLAAVVASPVSAGDYPRGWAVRRDHARAILQRFGYAKQATILDPGGKAHFVLQQANGIFPRVAERYVGPGGKQWVLTATGTGYAGPRRGRHEIQVGPLPGQDRVRLEVGDLGLQPAPRRWDGPPTLTDSVPSLVASIRLSGGQTYQLTLERVGKKRWRTPQHLHPSLGPRVSFEMDARGDIRELRVQAAGGELGQLGVAR